MKIIIRLFCLAAVLFIFDSCTVTKRHFGGGYHVEWKKKWKEEEGSTAKKQEVVSDTLSAQITPVSKSDSDKPASKKEEAGSQSVVTDRSGSTENERIDKPTTQSEASSQDGVITEDETVREEVKTASSTDEKPTDSGPKKRVEPLTWVAFAFLLAGIGVGLLPAAWFSSATIIVIVFALLLLVAFINAVSSAIRVKRNPEKYKAKPFTWLMVFFCSLAFVFAFILLIFYALFPSV